MAERPNAAVLKTAVLQGTGGSNPSSSDSSKAVDKAAFVFQFLSCDCAVKAVSYRSFSNWPMQLIMLFNLFRTIDEIYNLNHYNFVLCTKKFKHRNLNPYRATFVSDATSTTCS
jgi:hypothetical protein